MAAARHDILARYWVTKHSWRGKYGRMFVITATHLSTLNPNTFESTNEWHFSPGPFEIYPTFANRDFIRASPTYDSEYPGLFTLTCRKGRSGTKTLKFSCDFRSEILTDILRLASEYKRNGEDSKGEKDLVRGFRQRLAENWPDAGSDHGERIFQIQKYTRHFHWKDISLVITPYSVDEVTATSQRKVLASYEFKDIQALVPITDNSNAVGMIFGGKARIHVFSSVNRDEFVKTIVNAAKNIGKQIQTQASDEMSLNTFPKLRCGLGDGKEKSFLSLMVFNVDKHTPRHTDPVRRRLALTERHLVERDVKTDSIVSVRALADIYAVIRDPTDLSFAIEFSEPGAGSRYYFSRERDVFITALIDGAKTVGNADISLKEQESADGLRCSPRHANPSADIELVYMKELQKYDLNMDRRGLKGFALTCEAVNANMSPQGPVNLQNQKRATAMALENLLSQARIAYTNSRDKIPANLFIPIMQTVRRLICYDSGSEMFNYSRYLSEAVVKMVWESMDHVSDNDVALCSALDVFHVLLQPSVAGEERSNKSMMVCYGTRLEYLIALLPSRITTDTGSLVVNFVLDFVSFFLCDPFSDSTDSKGFEYLLFLIADLGRPFFKLLQHPCLPIVKAAGLLMRAIIDESNPEIAERMQVMALEEGALLYHLHAALFTKPSNTRQQELRQLSQYLVAMWVDGNDTSMITMRRILPHGLLSYLVSDESADILLGEEDDFIDSGDGEGDAADEARKKKEEREALERKAQMEKRKEISEWAYGLMRKFRGKDQQRIVIKTSRIKKSQKSGSSEGNWPLFFRTFDQNHYRADLIWNKVTRDELAECLSAEIRAFTTELLSTKEPLYWNYHEFRTPYPSLDKELCIDGYFIHALLSKGAKTRPLERPAVFFDQVYHRLLIEKSDDYRVLCLQAMTVVYSHFGSKIGVWEDLPYLVTYLRETNVAPIRDRILRLIERLIKLKENAAAFLEAGGISELMDLLTLAHLDKNKAETPLYAPTNLITAGSGMTRESEKEWYYRIPATSGNIDSIDDDLEENTQWERRGPIGLEDLKDMLTSNQITSATPVWAQGLSGWTAAKKVPILKWQLFSSGTPVLSETKMGVLILHMLSTLVSHYPSRNENGLLLRPLPRAKRELSNRENLHKLANMFLTYDPELVDSTAKLVTTLIEDNPYTLGHIYVTGVFFFSLMYPGSNYGPIARFLRLAHLGQQWEKDDKKKKDLDVAANSILGNILPEAMIHTLSEDQDPSRFVEAFLGDSDTPEFIWNAEMRRHMVEQIAHHVGDFPVRLASNPFAKYAYCNIPKVKYRHLEGEMFCQRYYLRNLCDLQRFPSWHVDLPVELLRAVLAQWRGELEDAAKEPSMNVELAYDTLGLDKGKKYSEHEIRRSYHRLAAKHHPDKNPDPESREIFEEVQKAYTYLIESQSAAPVTNANGESKNMNDSRVRISLILQTQCILFKRFAVLLKPYKYAGYPLLLETIRNETQSDSALQPDNDVLLHAAELCCDTVSASALNTEELRRSDGVSLLVILLSRCVGVLRPKNVAGHIAAKISTYILKTFSILSLFERGRETLYELCVGKHIEEEEEEDEEEEENKEKKGQSMMHNMIPDVTRCLFFFENQSDMVKTALECISNLAISSKLQGLLFKAGLHWHLVRFLLAYDETLALQDKKKEAEEEKRVFESDDEEEEEEEEERVIKKAEITADDGEEGVETKIEKKESETTDSEGSNVQRMANERAILAAKALQCMVGIDPVGSENIDGEPNQLHSRHTDTWVSLLSLLTPVPCKNLKNQDVNPFLVSVNRTYQTPTMIWNPSTRNELAAFLENILGVIYRGGPASEEHDPAAALKFRYADHRKELIIRGIFIRLYNAQPAFVLDFPDEVLVSLMKYLEARVPGSPRCAAMVAEEHKEITVHFINMVLEALVNVIKGHSGAEKGLSKGEFMNTLVSFLVPARPVTVDGLADEDYDTDPAVPVETQALVLRVIEAAVSRSAHCAQALVTSGVVSCVNDCLFVIDPHAKEASPLPSVALKVAYALRSHSGYIAEIVEDGGILMLLYLFVADSSSENRSVAATTLARMLSEQQCGQRCTLLIERFIPKLFVSVMKEDSDGAVKLFDTPTESPELIWNEEMKEQLSETLYDMCRSRHVSHAIAVRRAGSSLELTLELPGPFALPSPDWKLTYRGAAAELVISGVYVRLFIEQPTHRLRDPGLFLDELFDAFLKRAKKIREDPRGDLEDDLITVLATAIGCLMERVGGIADRVSDYYLRNTVECLIDHGRRRSKLRGAALNILHYCAESALVVETMAGLDVIGPFMKTVENDADHRVLAMSVLSKIMDKHEPCKQYRPCVVDAALQKGLVEFILKLLDDQTDRTEDAGMLRAHSVRCLKAMSSSMKDPEHGPDVDRILEEHPHWADYRDQRHDLFLSRGSTPGLLTGPTAVQALLTYTPHNDSEAEPPKK